LVLKSDWLTITYPADQSDILPFLLPKISDFRKKCAAVARDEVEIFQSVFSEMLGKIEESVKAFLGVEKLSVEFDTTFRLVELETRSISE